jgi:MerR family redox-sensitive transcriptional activator SoxR
MDEVLTISEVASRSGFSASALRFYEKEGLIEATRTSGGQRRYRRHELRRLAFIAAARHVGLTLGEIRRALALLPSGRTPTKADWAKITRSWRKRLDEEIGALESLRDGLDGCIGCGCLTLQRCRLSNPADIAATRGSGAVYLPEPLHPHVD